MINKIQVKPIPLCRPKKSDKWLVDERLSQRTIIVDHISKKVTEQKEKEKKRNKSWKKGQKKMLSMTDKLRFSNITNFILPAPSFGEQGNTLNKLVFPWKC